ncbi:hypothetical protein D3C87_1582260 [compost metagenome]
MLSQGSDVSQVHIGTERFPSLSKFGHRNQKRRGKFIGLDLDALQGWPLREAGRPLRLNRRFAAFELGPHTMVPRIQEVAELMAKREVPSPANETFP